MGSSVTVGLIVRVSFPSSKMVSSGEQAGQADFGLDDYGPLRSRFSRLGAGVLERQSAQGVCGSCQGPVPGVRRSDGNRMSPQILMRITVTGRN